MQLSNKELGKYLKYSRNKKGYSTYKVNKLCDVSPSYLSLVENGKRKASAIILKTLAPIYDLDYIDLYEKAGYIDLIDDEKKSIYEIDELGNPVVSIPILGIVKAGYDYLAQENWIGTTTLDKKIADSGEFFALKVKGDSMIPAFFEGDTVIFRKQNYCENNQVAVVIVNGNEGTLKKVKKLDDGGIKLIPFNKEIDPETEEPYYKTLTFTKEEIEELPIIIAGVFQELKRTELNF